jgi:peptide/nickel transport system substrate-binding protein
MWRNDPTNPNAEEPPAYRWIWDIWGACDRMWLEPDETQRNAIFEDILDTWADELPMIGILGEMPAPIIVKNGIHNYREGLPVDDPLKDEHH